MMKRLCLVILLALSATAHLYAQRSSGKESHDSIRIEQVNFRGNRRIPASTIDSWITTREGEAYKPEQPDHDVHTLFATGHFDDVKVYVEDGERGSKIITFEVMERPLILGIEYEGIDADKQAQIAEEWRQQKIELSKGLEYDPVTIRRAARIIQDMLAREGDSSKRVAPFVSQKSPTEVTITFKVE